MFRTSLAAVALSCLAASALAQTKWDLPTAYPSNNFHTENITQFASDVDKGSAGKLKITVHSNASLFKAPEIKRAVQGGQAQLGEILLVNFQNEWQVFGTDGIRGVAGQEPLDARTVFAFGRALGEWACRHPERRVLIGRDTRASGPELAALVAAGVQDSGAEPHFAGVVTTPAVAYLTRTGPFSATNCRTFRNWNSRKEFWKSASQSGEIRVEFR